MNLKLIPTPHWKTDIVPDLPKLQTKYPDINFLDKVKRKSDKYVFKIGDWLKTEKGIVVQIIGFDVYKLPSTFQYDFDTDTNNKIASSKKITRAFYNCIGQIIADDIEKIIV